MRRQRIKILERLVSHYLYLCENNKRDHKFVLQ